MPGWRTTYKENHFSSDAFLPRDIHYIEKILKDVTLITPFLNLKIPMMPGTLGTRSNEDP